MHSLNLSELNIDEQNRLIAHLSGFTTPERFKKFCNVLEQRTDYLAIALENIYQSQNASAILRTCECMGVQDIHAIEKKYAYQINPDVVMGANNWVSLHRYRSNIENNTTYVYQQLRNKGYKIIATCLHHEAKPMYDIKIDRPIVLVFGTEKEGLSETAIEQADERMIIPMCGFTESYNISVAAAISMAHFLSSIKNSSNSWKLSPEKQNMVMLQWLKHSIKSFDQISQNFLGKLK